MLDDSTTCGDGWEVYEDIHIWDRQQKKSKAEVKTLRKSIVAAVMGISSIGDDYELIDISMSSARTIRDPDGLTEHGIITFRFLTQEK